MASSTCLWSIWTFHEACWHRCPPASFGGCSRTGARGSLRHAMRHPKAAWYYEPVQKLERLERGHDASASGPNSPAKSILNQFHNQGTTVKLYSAHHPLFVLCTPPGRQTNENPVAVPLPQVRSTHSETGMTHAEAKPPAYICSYCAHTVMKLLLGMKPLGWFRRSR